MKSEATNIPDCTQDPIGALKAMFVDLVMGQRLARGQSPALRPVFLKTHGVAGGVFRVLPDLPAELRVGLLNDQAFPVIVRFSSDTLPSVADEKTTLGIGIKLFDVPGTKLLHPEAGTCDFVMQNHPVFFVDTARSMCEFTRAGVVDGNYQPYLDSHPVTARILNDMQKVEKSVLTATYWGILPHALGEGRVVKYKLVPRLTSAATVANESSNRPPNYLYSDLKDRLLTGNTLFDFYVQFQTDSKEMPLEAATVLWSEELSPPVQVATLEIPAQNIDAPGQSSFGGNLSFNIWQTLPEHTPLGSIADARKIAYEAAADLRRAQNRVSTTEPTEPFTTMPPLPSDSTVIRAAVFPPIGFARVGNSKAEGSDGFFVGPEVSAAPALPVGGYKDKQGALKRQAARFRIYGYNAAGAVVAELTPDNAAIEWTVHLANKKAAWYQFQLALDIPEASAAMAPLSKRRNGILVGEDREKLVIDPGPRTIHGCETSGSTYHFDSGKFFGLRVPLGELRTDGAGRLLVLGGFGLSQSVVGQPPQEFANNDGWHDDVSDGPVDARVLIGGREIPVEGAWVVVGPPNYAPTIKTVRTLYDLLYDRMVKWKLAEAPGKISFAKHIRPIFERFSGLQWVNLGFASWFGANAPHDFERLMGRLADKSPENQEFRKRILEQFRNPRAGNLGKSLWPQFYGDGLDSLIGKLGPDASLNVPDSLASLAPLQFGWLLKWAAGDFDSNPFVAAPTSLDTVPVVDQPHTLTEAALAFCLADAFHPGCEVTWIVRSRWLYSGAFRIRRKPADFVEPDYGEVLQPDAAVSPLGPLNGAGPGDITRWMAIPWQTDTASCLSGYSFFNSSPSLPTFWPARVPNHVLIEADFQILIDPNQPPQDRLAAFQCRLDWYRGFVKDTETVQMITDFHKLGLVEERTGPSDLPGVPERIWVESKPDLPEPARAVMMADAALPQTSGSAQQRRYSLRKFGKKRS